MISGDWSFEYDLDSNIALVWGDLTFFDCGIVIDNSAMKVWWRTL